MVDENEPIPLERAIQNLQASRTKAEQVNALEAFRYAVIRYRQEHPKFVSTVMWLFNKNGRMLTPDKPPGTFEYALVLDDQNGKVFIPFLFIPKSERAKGMLLSNTPSLKRGRPQPCSAFEAEAFHGDFLFAQADDEADDFAVEAGDDFVLRDEFDGFTDAGAMMIAT